MDNEYYVYEYISDNSKEIMTSDDKCIFIKKGTPFYIGKGKGNRVTTGIRNLECEKFKKELGWEYNIKKDRLSEEEALNIEKELIQEYLDKEIYLTNCLSGNSSQADIETLRVIKYLLILIDNEIIKMQIADMKRRCVSLELVKPSGDVIGRLFEKYYFSDEEMISL